MFERFRWLLVVAALAALLCAVPARGQEGGTGTTTQPDGSVTTAPDRGTDTTTQPDGTGTTAQDGGDTTSTRDGTTDDVGREPLEVTIDRPADGSTIPPSGEIAFTVSDPGAAVTCSLGTTPRDPCTSPVRYGPLQPGQSLEFGVVASLDREQTEATASYTVAATQTRPLSVVIQSAPSGNVNERAATVSFRASRSSASFLCTLDNHAAAVCSSPRVYRDLSIGAHVFRVVAVDGRMRSKPAGASWTVAAIGSTKSPNDPPAAPRAVIVSGPHGKHKSHKARFRFTAHPTAARFQCSIDGSAFAGCRSPRSYTKLATGSHTFRVRALAASGGAGPSASRSWTVAAGQSTASRRTTDKTRGDGEPIVVILLAALGALLAVALPLSLRRLKRVRLRANWQLAARCEPPENPCSKQGHYCQKETKVKVKPGRRRVADVVVHARNGDHLELDRYASGKVVRQLNGALREYRRTRDADRLRTTLVPVGALLVGEIALWLADDTVRNEVTADARVIAAEVECEFTLYTCKKRGDRRAWETEDKWTASVEDERTDTAIHLDRNDPVAELVESAIDQLAAFLRGLEEPTRLEVSGKVTV
jgi:hypothetical protein